MKAVEFIKQYGWSEAKRILHDARGCASVRLYGKYEFSTDDLKQLVDAWELVGGIGHSLNSVKQFCDLAGDMKYLQKRGKLILVEDIRKAIELVESVK